MFIDQAEIIVKSGKGGDGCISFRREKYVEKGGPDGGNGGRGGDVYVVASSRYQSLYDFTKKRHFFAEDGSNGKGALKHGKSGKDMFVNVPCGTLVYVYDETKDIKTLKADLVKDGQKVRIAVGGRGGRGNATFKTANRVAPRIAEKGEPAKTAKIILELKLIANIGLLGYPNVGKSTFLSVVTNAKPKIADYPFTTIKPNLGVIKYYDKSFVIADIPGIIEGAHKGIGLGTDFLRHVERTKLLLHLIDISSDIYQDFVNMNKELILYSKKLAKQKQIVLITKKDIKSSLDKSSKAEIEKIKKRILNNKTIKVLGVFEISSVSRDGLDDVLKFLYNKLDKKSVDDVEGVFSIENIQEFTLEQGFYVEKNDGVFYVKGEKIERLVAVTFFNEPESLMRFQAIINKMGINDALKKEGIKEGDLVVIGDFEFYYE